jgi:hypothetical protein
MSINALRHFAGFVKGPLPGGVRYCGLGPRHDIADGLAVPVDFEIAPTEAIREISVLVEHAGELVPTGTDLKRACTFDAARPPFPRHNR